MAVKVVDQSNFEAEVLSADGTVIVDFWATWCMPCQMMHPIVEELAEKHPEVKVCKIDCDENMELAKKYKVLSIPTFLVFRGGDVVDRAMGVRPVSALEELIR